MKTKIFNSNVSAHNMQVSINDFLNDPRITVVHVLQSSEQNRTIITIFYTE